jgi:hypothetical protein
LVRLKLDHAYGREFPGEELAKYALVVHCGGCMIDKQKLRARMEDCRDAGVPITNYGLLLSYAASPRAILRAIDPWGVSSDPALLQGLAARTRASSSEEADHAEQKGVEACREHLYVCRGCKG